MPSVVYGRRFSTPVADAEKVEPLYDPDVGTLFGSGVRSFALYSDYYEVNDNLDWTQLGMGRDTGRKNHAFDCCTPAGIYERQAYALAMADHDTAFFVNGGSGWIFGTPAVMQPFLREYRALPARPFTSFAGGRDPVAVWQRSEPDGLWFYAVNRLPVPLQVVLRLDQPGEVRTLATGEAAPTPGGALSFTLAPYMLKGFRAGPAARLTACTAKAPADYVASLAPLLPFARDLRARLRSKPPAAGLTGEQVQQATDVLDAAIQAGERGEWAGLHDGLARLPLIRLYAAIGTYPPGLFSPQAGK